jgi:hypothetical protein
MLRHHTTRPAGRALGSSLRRGPLEPKSSPGRAPGTGAQACSRPTLRPGQKPARDLGRTRTVGVSGTRVLCPTGNGGACCGLTKRPLRHSEHARPLSNIEMLSLPIWGSMLLFWYRAQPAREIWPVSWNTQRTAAVCCPSQSASFGVSQAEGEGAPGPTWPGPLGPNGPTTARCTS